MALPIVGALLPVVGKVLDRVLPDEEARAAAKLKLLELEQDGEFRELEAAVRVVEAEAKSEHWLTATWRPIVMLFFAGLVGAHWLGFTPENLPEGVVLSLLDIVQVGIGGYVVGRSAEKVAKAWKDKG